MQMLVLSVTVVPMLVATAAVLTTAATVMLLPVVVAICLCRSHQRTCQKLRYRRIYITRNTGVHLDARSGQCLNSATVTLPSSTS